MPCCPCCHSNARVQQTNPDLEKRFFCPCNEPGPAYFDAPPPVVHEPYVARFTGDRPPALSVPAGFLRPGENLSLTYYPPEPVKPEPEPVPAGPGIRIVNVSNAEALRELIAKNPDVIHGVLNAIRKTEDRKPAPEDHGWIRLPGRLPTAKDAGPSGAVTITDAVGLVRDVFWDAQGFHDPGLFWTAWRPCLKPCPALETPAPAIINLNQRTAHELEMAWGIITNASGGDWSKQNEEWVQAAAAWEKRVMPSVGEFNAREKNKATAPEPAGPAPAANTYAGVLKSAGDEYPKPAPEPENLTDPASGPEPVAQDELEEELFPSSTPGPHPVGEWFSSKENPPNDEDGFLMGTTFGLKKHVLTKYQNGHVELMPVDYVKDAPETRWCWCNVYDSPLIQKDHALRVKFEEMLWKQVSAENKFLDSVNAVNSRKRNGEYESESVETRWKFYSANYGA